jgi:hypothetical protein
VSYAYVDISAALERALNSGIVLTTNERLRRELVRSFDIQQQRRGLRAWQTARVFSVQGWLVNLYQQACRADGRLPNLISREQTLLMLRNLAPGEQRHLSNLMLQGWEQLHQWRIPLTDDALATSDNGRLFQSWARKLDQALVNAGQLTSVQLPERSELLEHLSAAPICCLDFDNPPAQITHWLERVADRGLEVSYLDSDRVESARVHRQAFATPDTELAAVAEWCRSRLQLATENQDGNSVLIGVVVPDLANRYQSVLRQFLAQFSPLGETLNQVPFDIAGGSRLVDQPIWQAAEAWLELCFRQLSTSRAQTLMSSRYLNLPDTARPWPDMLPEIVDLGTLARGLGSPALTELIPEGASRSRAFTDWLTLFEKCLERAGWRADDAQSTQYQAYQQLTDLLQEFQLHTGERPLTAAAALDELRAAMSLRVFAPERTPAPIQILGYLETTGLKFTDLWVCGMDEESWPAAVHNNPLLSLAVRQKYRLPRSTPADELDFARQRLSHWRSACDVLVTSYAQQNGEATQAASPLIREFPEQNPLDHPGSRSHPYFHSNVSVESILDSHGTPLQPGLKSGGTGLMRDQAGCPFRAWAIHRLGLSDARGPHAFPDPLDRGTLVHEAMQQFYREYAGEDQDLPLAEPDEQKIDLAIEQSLRKHYRRFPAAFVQREHERLRNVLKSWLALEAERAPFQISAVEFAAEVDVGELRIRIRIDRLDRMDDALIVIDYKTGQIQTPARSGRLLDPQLPIYTLLDEAVQGVVFARLDEETPRVVGVADKKLDLGKASISAPLDEQWRSQQQAWRAELDTLANELSAGFAAVQPRRPDICARCHLAGLCRIAEPEIDADDF